MSQHCHAHPLPVVVAYLTSPSTPFFDSGGLHMVILPLPLPICNDYDDDDDELRRSKREHFCTKVSWGMPRRLTRTPPPLFNSFDYGVMD